ncbi:MAG: NAD(P)H-dependent flavin oxidoreductase [Janthinobacterium lividum]
MNDIRALFGIAHPLVQAPMAGIQGSALAIAVSNAGALGSLPCAMLTPEALVKELEAVSRATPHPCNLNFFCHTTPEPDAARDAAWQNSLATYFAELEVDPSTVQPGTGRTPFDAQIADAIEPFRPPVVSFHFGLPAPGLVAHVKSWGTKVISSATTVEEARWLEAHGADAIIAQGLEAGGHRGMFLTADLTTQIGTMALVPQMVAAVRVPVIAAGGIADACGVSAAMALGAAGVQVGTAYMLCPEATTSGLHRAALKSGRAAHTVLTNLFTGRPARSIRNRLIAELGPIGDTPAFPLAGAALMSLKAAAEKVGHDDFSSLWAGQNSGGCREVGAAELTLDLVRRLMR